MNARGASSAVSRLASGSYGYRSASPGIPTSTARSDGLCQLRLRQQVVRETGTPAYTSALKDDGRRAHGHDPVFSVGGARGVPRGSPRRERWARVPRAQRRDAGSQRRQGVEQRQQQPLHSECRSLADSQSVVTSAASGRARTRTPSATRSGRSTGRRPRRTTSPRRDRPTGPRRAQADEPKRPGRIRAVTLGAARAEHHARVDDQDQDAVSAFGMR